MSGAIRIPSHLVVPRAPLYALRAGRSDLWTFADLSTEALCAHSRPI
ncbi:MAG: hypothetical protein NXH83_02940 [Rhodobacteraceae bacterium]|nr:hypothetical protein [Paracoccaceae bacterium]